MASISDLQVNGTEPLLESSSYAAQKSFLSFQKQWIKWFGLILVCLYPFGRAWVYDNPQALETTLIASMGISAKQYNLLYTVYSVPNYILPLFTGYLIDKYGIKFGIVWFGSFVVIGQFLFCLGCSIPSYGLAIAGRFLFGLGGESTLMVKYFMLIAWFKNKELGFASGTTFFSQRLASTFNSIFTPMIYQSSQSLGWTTGIGFIICLLSQICGLVWLFLDKKNVKRRETSVYKLVPKPEFKQILKFKPFTFVYTIIAMLNFGVFISFTANGNSFLQQQYGFTQSQAGDMFSIMYVIAAISTPIFGKIIDIIGHKVNILILSFVVLALSMFLFMFLPSYYHCYIGFFPLVCLGLANAMYSSSYWPSMVMLEKKEYFGLVNGFIHICYNIAVGIYPLLVGLIQDNTSKSDMYYYVLLLEGVSSCIGVLVTILLEVMNRKERRGLNKKINPDTDTH